MNLRHLTLAALGFGATTVVACGGTPTFDATLEAAVKAAPPKQAAKRCDAGRWTGAINPEGRPDGFDAGDAGAVYVWHDSDGWHIRTTDRRAIDHHYTGTIRLSPAGSFTDVRAVRDEKDDKIFLVRDGALRYHFRTFASIDGADFRVTCPPERKGEVEHQRLTFHTEFDGHPVADRVRIGDSKQSPSAAAFAFTRTS
jgi:hypothetical protein